MRTALAVLAALSLAACVPAAVTPAGHPAPRAVVAAPVTGPPPSASPGPSTSPSASAPASVPFVRWEYYCFVVPGGLGVTSAVQGFERALNDAGREGWELAIQEQSLVCMKRPSR